MKREKFEWVGIIIAALVYSAMVLGLMMSGLRSCVAEADESAVKNVSFPAFERSVVDSTSVRVLEGAGIENTPVEPVEPPKLYTERDAVVLAKTVWGEARGVPAQTLSGGTASTECQWAAVVWTILNRFDAGYADTIADVAAAPKQFHGYKESYPVEEDILELVIDVLDRWNAEKNGESDVGRVLPADYLWFGGDGTYNYFRNEYRGGNRWDWELGDPYAA